jgi:hypothetical protein
MANDICVIVKGIIYIMEQEKCKEVLRLGEKYATERTIYALERDEVIEMVNKSYKSERTLKKAIMRFMGYGFKVYYKK